MRHGIVMSGPPAPSDPPPTLLEDYLSGDRLRVLHATWTTIASRDPELLDPLVEALPRIRKATEQLELGGVLASNNGNVDHSLEKLENYRRGRCWCTNYPGLLSYDPAKEQHAGHANVVETSDPGWSMTYDGECTVCGQSFAIEQGDYHVTWWKWVPRGVKRGRSRSRPGA